MKKMILGAGALLLSSTAFAGTVHANSVNDPLTPASTAYATGAAWAMSPALQSAAVQAGMNHVHPAAETDWLGDQLAAKGMWSDKAVSSLYGEFDSTMSYEEAAAFTGDKNDEPTAAQMSEKQSWLAQNDASGEVDLDAGKGEMDGQGGPFEAADADSERTEWPACRPGPGDDRCIQLYERGVSRAYAQWSAGRSRMAMGGPEETVTAKADSATGPTTEPTGVRAEGKPATSADTSADTTSAGMGMAEADSAKGEKADKS